MIAFIKSWCEGIIVALMLSIIIEMLIPEGNNKKYVKVVIGIYILFVIIGPFLEKINTDFDLQNIFQIETIEVSTDVNDNIKDVYVKGIEETIKNELIEKGYLVENVKVNVDSQYENIDELEIIVCKKDANEILIEPIMIGENQIEEKENTELKKILSENYQVSQEKIFIFEN